jgi:hypothetical protein
VAVVAVFEGVTQNQYEEAVRKLTGGKSRLESPADWPAPGLLVHAAGQGFDRFPGRRRLGVRGRVRRLRRDARADSAGGRRHRPEVYPTHTFVSG